MAKKLEDPSAESGVPLVIPEDLPESEGVPVQVPELVEPAPSGGGSQTGQKAGTKKEG